MSWSQQGDDDDDTPVDACPTHYEVLQAVSVINSYVNTQDSPFAHKMETILASFGRQMHLEESRTMASTCINDYVTRHNTRK